jgi:hypothetical protein
VSEPQGVAQLKKKDNAKPIVNSKKCRKVLLLESSHCRELHECLHSILGDEYMVTKEFKPNATLAMLLGKLKH